MTKRSRTMTDLGSTRESIAASDGRTGQFDAAAIRRTYDAVLWGGGTVPAPGERERLGALLRGHVQLLMPGVAACVRRIRGEDQRVAVHVIAGARRTLQGVDGAPMRADDVWDLATYCRALLSLYTLHHGSAPLDGQTAEGANR
ncbi:DUF6415 family natural product biosynthesis protein [Streptomyces sp. NPDC008222]|uniref:DUF6415 family natural product biosynthesis protein n=1 Tax=Streptomyces sp. NPDC008222 TaxID=3364820 RepID=UPI0036E51041